MTWLGRKRPLPVPDACYYQRKATSTVRAKRDAENGLGEWVEMPCPAEQGSRICSMQDGCKRRKSGGGRTVGEGKMLALT